MTATDETCIELDGCCYTHGPCFDEIAAALEGVVGLKPCEGWPCPRPNDPPRDDR